LSWKDLQSDIQNPQGAFARDQMSNPLAFRHPGQQALFPGEILGQSAHQPSAAV
jgi:hypothetical protein